MSDKNERFSSFALSVDRSWLDGAMVTAISIALVLVYYLNTDLLTYSHPNFSRGWFQHNFIAMATDPSQCTHTLQCNRVLKPFVASLLPFELQTSAIFLTMASLVVTAVLIYYIALELGFDREIALVAPFAYIASGWATQFQLHFFWLTGSMAYVFVALCILAVLRDNDLLFLFSLLLGILTRETAILTIIVYYAYNARTVIDLSTVKRAVLLTIPALGAWTVVQFLMPSDFYLIGLLEWATRPSANGDANLILRFLRNPQFTLLYNVFVNPYGVLILLPLFGIVRNYKNLLPLFGGFWLAAHLPFLILDPSTVNIARHLTIAIPIVVLLSLYGIERLSDGLSTLLPIFRPWYFALYFVAIVFVQAVLGSSQYPMQLPMQILLLLGFVFAIVGLAAVTDIVDELKNPST